MFEIEHALLKSRFTKTKSYLDKLTKSKKDLKNLDKEQLEKIKKEFNKNNKNYFDKKYPLPANSSFTKIIDLSRDDD